MSEQTYTIAADGGAITCHRCGRTSYNPNDVWQRYCGACKAYHDAAPGGTMSDLDTIRTRWADEVWTYDEEREGETYVASAFLVNHLDQVLLDLDEPTSDECMLLQQCAAAPGDVQALLAVIAPIQSQLGQAHEALAAADAERDTLTTYIARLEQDREYSFNRFRQLLDALEQLRAALAWYADAGNYDSFGAPGVNLGIGDWQNDGGARAGGAPCAVQQAV